MFGMPDRTSRYLIVGPALRGFGEVLQGADTYEAKVKLDAVWGDRLQLYAVMNAVKILSIRTRNGKLPDGDPRGCETAQKHKPRTAELRVGLPKSYRFVRSPFQTTQCVQLILSLTAK
jgi:hypothetical protein